MKKFIAILSSVSILTINSVYADITTALLGQWKFNEGSGTTTTADSTGNGNTGNLVGSPSWITGKIGSYALQFDGSSQSMNAAINLSGTNKVTIAFWLWVNSYTNADHLVAEYSPNFNTANSFFVDVDASDGKCDVYTHNSFEHYNGGSIVRVPAAEWHHYVITFDNTVGAALGETAYIDGSPVTITALSTGNMSSVNFDNTTLYLMSRHSDNLYLAGKMDEVRIYSRILSSSDAAELYNYTEATGRTRRTINIE